MRTLPALDETTSGGGAVTGACAGADVASARSSNEYEGMRIERVRMG